MNLKELFRSDDRAVSPVLGVALLIAITVILAGVVAFVVLGVDANNAEAPQASLDFTQADNATAANGIDVELKHTGGSILTAENIDVRIKEDASGTLATGLDDLDPTSDIATGDSVMIAGYAESGDRISVVWNDPDSDREVLLGQYTVE